LAGYVLPVLTLFDIHGMMDWRVANAVMAAILGWWALTYPRRRRAASPARVPKPEWLVVAILDFTALALTVNAIIVPADWTIGIYSAAVAAIPICGGAFFLLSLIFRSAGRVESTEPGAGAR
jgi:hypothetical protein